jgi:hypothetical protein
LQQPATKNHTRKKIKNHIPSPPDKKKRRNNIFLRIGGVLVLSSLLFKFITLWFERDIHLVHKYEFSVEATSA